MNPLFTIKPLDWLPMGRTSFFALTRVWHLNVTRKKNKTWRWEAVDKDGRVVVRCEDEFDTADGAKVSVEAWHVEAIRNLLEPAGRASEKSNAEIVADANALAAKFYGREGKDKGKGLTFHDAHHPEEIGMWELAVLAYDHIEGTDVENAAALLLDEEGEDDAAS